ncbi:peroxiredoxin [Spirochaetota bacterium]
MVGKKVPAMTLDGFYKGKIQEVKLSRYKGKWMILFFYPADFTFICPTELKELADYYSEFKSVGAEILSVSTDSVYVHRAWHKHHKSVNKVQYPMLSDRSGKLSRFMGVYDGNTGMAMRGTFVINPLGYVVAYEVHHDSIGRSADELLRKLNAAIAVSGGYGGVCPAAWKKGQKLIHPK